MTTNEKQLELGLEAPARPALRRAKESVGTLPERLRFVAGRLVYWAPVWLPLIACLQIALLGLRPERHEGRGIEVQEARMGARIECNR